MAFSAISMDLAFVEIHKDYVVESCPNLDPLHI